jgi:hypothetical protein
MYARTTTVRGDPQAVDEGITHVRENTGPTLQGMSGCVGDVPARRAQGVNP